MSQRSTLQLALHYRLSFSTHLLETPIAKHFWYAGFVADISRKLWSQERATSWVPSRPPLPLYLHKSLAAMFTNQSLLPCLPTPQVQVRGQPEEKTHGHTSFTNDPTGAFQRAFINYCCCHLSSLAQCCRSPNLVLLDRLEQHSHNFLFVFFLDTPSALMGYS